MLQNMGLISSDLDLANSYVLFYDSFPFRSFVACLLNLLDSS
jgi:hypothetical protein